MHRPTKGRKKRHNGRQRETRHTGRRARHPKTHHPKKGNKKGHNGRQSETRPSGRPDTTSNKGKQEGVQWEAKGD